jgi:hypothetical protein
MPKELHDAEQFEKLLSKGIELRVVRGNKSVKLKLRTPEYLYTLKTTEETAEDIIKGAKDLALMEIGKKVEKEAQTKPEEKKKD